MATAEQMAKWVELDREELIDEIERLNAMLDGRFKDVRLAQMGPDGKGAFVFELKTGMSGLMAEHMLQVMTLDGGTNFVQVEAQHPDHGPMTFTIERRFGRSPAVQLAEAQARIAELEAGGQMS